MTNEIKLTAEQEKNLKLFEKAVGVTGQVADSIIASNGWTVASQLHEQVLRHVLRTQEIVMPMFAKIEEIKTSISDSVGFQKSLQNVMIDLEGITNIVTALEVTHEGKSGAVAEEDLPLVNTLITKYSSLKTILENGIDGLLTSMCAMLHEAGWSEEKLMSKETQ